MELLLSRSSLLLSIPGFTWLQDPTGALLRLCQERQVYVPSQLVSSPPCRVQLKSLEISKILSLESKDKKK